MYKKNNKNRYSEIKSHFYIFFLKNALKVRMFCFIFFSLNIQCRKLELGLIKNLPIRRTSSTNPQSLNTLNLIRSLTKF